MGVGNPQRLYLAVVGAGDTSSEMYEMAVIVGREAALRGWILITGGLGGVMEAAARGAGEMGGLTLGILPGADRSEANPYIDIAAATNIRHARNSIIAHTADAIIAINGEYGTPSEVALALKLGKPVVGIRTSWTVPGLISAGNPKDAIEKVLDVMRKITYGSGSNI